MILLKNILARIWALWGMLSFMVSFLIIFLPSMAAYLFKDTKKGQAYFILVSKLWMDAWLLLIACPLKVTGKEVFKKNEFNKIIIIQVVLI